MSIIFGIFDRKEKEIDGSHLKIMEDALAYWEVDDKGIWNEGSIVLGHQMLWSTPESKLEHLPHSVYLDNQTLAITIDARLDNREVLVEQLGMTEIPFEQITDSDLLLAAYMKWGEACPKYLLGDFVFVIWDAHKEHFLCVRDHIGIKSFYYYLSDDIFVFSTDIRGVIAHPDVSKKYNDRSIAMFLAGSSGFYDTKNTFYTKIQKLSAGTSMVVRKKSVSESVYWDIENIPKIHYDTYEEYVDKLRELLLDAVKVRLRTVYPVASHLSGGLDSSSIAVLAARKLEKKNKLLYSFNWIETPEGEHDPVYSEWGFATQLAKLENIEQKSIKLTPEFTAAIYDKIDISTDDTSLFWGEYLVRDKAEEHGVRSILSGWGGDELISATGRTYFAGLFQKGQFKKAMKALNVVYKGKNYKYLRIMARYFKLLFYVFIYIRIHNLYQKNISTLNPFEFALEPFASSAKKFSFLSSDFLYTEMSVNNRQKAFFRNGHLLQRIENWASSAIGNRIEYSYPLLDKRIVEFALAIPEELYAPKEGHQRLLFKNAISDFLPENIVRANKNYEPVHWRNMKNIWSESLEIWIQNNEKVPENRNCYINREKVINHIKIYLLDKKNGVKDVSEMGLASILLSNLKSRDSKVNNISR